jgi:hypothetical protein
MRYVTHRPQIILSGYKCNQVSTQVCVHARGTDHATTLDKESRNKVPYLLKFGAANRSTNDMAMHAKDVMLPHAHILPAYSSTSLFLF